MRKVKHISIVLTLAPLFFMGCTQDKVSRVIPSKSTDSQSQIILTSSENIIENKQLSKEPISNSELDKLVALVQRKLAEDTISNKKPIKLFSLKALNLKAFNKLPVQIEILPEEEEIIPTSMQEEVFEIEASDFYIDTDHNELDDLMELVSIELDTDSSMERVQGVYSTPIVLNDEIEVEVEAEIKTEKKLEKFSLPEITKEEEIVATAIAYLDTQYIWAANGPSAFDCSGFTKYVFKEHGLTIPRYSGHQAKVGIKVAYNELEVGDLVFFGTDKKHKKKVNHVGIYMGNNKFIHASSAKKKVVITSFKKKHFYKKSFLWGQRVLKDNSTYASL